MFARRIRAPVHERLHIHTETWTWLFHTISIKSLNFEISKTVLKLLGSFPARPWVDHVFDSWYPVYLDKSGKSLCERRRRHGVVAETFHQYHCFANSAIGTAVVFQCSLNLELWICHCISNVGNTGTWHWMCAFVRQPINSFFWLQLVVCLDARTNPCSSSRRKRWPASLSPIANSPNPDWQALVFLTRPYDTSVNVTFSRS